MFNAKICVDQRFTVKNYGVSDLTLIFDFRNE